MSQFSICRLFREDIADRLLLNFGLLTFGDREMNRS